MEVSSRAKPQSRTHFSSNAIAHALFVTNGIVTVILGPLLPLLSARSALNDTQAGYLVTAQFVLLTCHLGLCRSSPSAWLPLDHGNRPGVYDLRHSEPDGVHVRTGNLRYLLQWSRNRARHTYDQSARRSYPCRLPCIVAESAQFLLERRRHGLPIPCCSISGQAPGSSVSLDNRCLDRRVDVGTDRGANALPIADRHSTQLGSRLQYLRTPTAVLLGTLF